MAINKKEIFKTVKIKKGKGDIEVCNYDKKIIINPKDKASVIEKKVGDCFDKKPKQSAVSFGAETLQAPDNDWMVLKDTDFYKVPDSQKGTLEKKQGVGLGRISKVKANLVFVRYQGTLRKMLRLDRGAPYNYIDAENAIPYYKYVLQNKSRIGIDPKGYELIAWAEKLDKSVKSGTLSFDGNTNIDLSFDGNTNIDLSFDGDSNADGASTFKVKKQKAKIFSQDKSTGIIHFTKKRLGRGSKVTGTIIPKGEFKFRKKNKKTKAISLITKTAGFVKIGENDKANILIHIGALRPVVKKSSFEGNTALDLGFDGNTNLDLGIDGGRISRPRRIRGLRPRRRGLRRGLGRGRGLGLGRRNRRFSSLDGNTNLDLGFDGNTNLDLGFDGGYHRPAMDVTPNNIDLSADGSRVNRGRHLGRTKSSFNGGALNEDFHGGGDMLYFDGSEEMSNAFGDWVKSIFSKEKRAERKAKKALSKEQAAVLSNPNKVVYTEDEMKAVYESSGSTKPFAEWSKSEGAKNMFNSMAQFGAIWLEQQSKKVKGETTEGEKSTEQVIDETINTGSGSGSGNGEKTILGLHPVTFTIAAVATGLLAIGGIYLMSRNKSVPTPVVG